MSEILQLEPARAERTDTIQTRWQDPHWIAEEKCDGYRYLMHFGGPCSRIYMTSRRGSESGRNVPQLGPQQTFPGLGYTVIDGEVIPPAGCEFSDLAGYMNTDPISAMISRRSVGEIEYRVFDILFVNGTDVRHLPLSERLKFLEIVMAQVFEDHPYTREVRRSLQDTFNFTKQLLLNGAEGTVLKDLRKPYGAKGAWLKAKRVSTVDAVIVGWEPGYDQAIGVAQLAVSSNGTLVPVGNVGLANTRIRNQINANPDAYLGTVIEVAALKFVEALREPRFVRLRPDMPATDCTLEKLQRDMMRVELG